MIPLKIITTEEAEKLGFTKKTDIPRGGGALEYAYGVIGKPGPDGKKETGEIFEHFRIHIKTGKKEIISEKEEWKKYKKKEKINEYEEKKKLDNNI